MKSDLKILILTEKYGNGHFQVAKTLKQEFENLDFNKVVISELYNESHPIISKITKFLYIKSFSVGKQFYKLFYYGVDKIYNKRFMNIYFKLGSKRLEELIQTEKPDIIINTFPMIVVPEYRNRTGKVIPTFNVVTDFCLHKIWVHDNIDKYYVASPNVKKKLVELGTHPDQVKVTGIPIRSRFEKPYVSDNLFEKYKIDRSKEVVLIMAGAHGVLKNVKGLCESFLNEPNLQVVVCCGNNHELKKKLEPIAAKYPETIIPLGYIEQMDELFRISSCMITKPGGITLSEATALGVPVMLYKPVPGQEKENALFFEEQNSAIIVNRQEEIKDAVLHVLKDKQKLFEMKESIKELYSPYASRVIVEDVIEAAASITGRNCLQNQYGI
ncbi:diglucosyl diacylglycerol synthase [Metabacillus arenae]|uniref:Diglucosyl diacylglycerol synthase n=1 Tax=Metabacillus arenae TaxID=2771434 RepID=A0A926NG51_9BACI|nr:diglucosyl diacylglycerol synthase [Metabacillus arenae]MBD1380190.1 diglucosyl diacylglycerol synthase [Metabacillus arenae]